MKSVESDPSGGHQIVAYSQAQPPVFRAICEALRGLIDAALPKATSKVWHGSPVWFIEGNPVAGYSATAKAVCLLFWNGRAFDEPGLKPVGKYRAAQVVFDAAAEIDPKAIRRCLRKAKSDVLDSKAYFRTNGTERGQSHQLTVRLGVANRLPVARTLSAHGRELSITGTDPNGP